MTDDTKPVPEPGEAQRGDDGVHYYEVDETNVGETDESEKPDADETDAED